MSGSLALAGTAGARDEHGHLLVNEAAGGHLLFGAFARKSLAIRLSGAGLSPLVGAVAPPP